MSRDRKLREVLDTLSGDPARSLPSQDRELMESVLRRLKIQESQRLVRPGERLPGPEPSELDEAREEALHNQQALQELRARQEHDAEEMNRLQEERERLLAHQQELEERLARLEAASHGGPLSYVEENLEPETVEFSRVDLNNHQNNEDDLLEFQHIDSEDEAFETPEGGAWEPDETESPDWSETDWPETPQDQEQTQKPPEEIGVSGDEDEDVDDEPDWENATAEEKPWPGTPVEDEPHEPQAAEPWQEPDEIESPDWSETDWPETPQDQEQTQKPPDEIGVKWDEDEDVNDEPDWEPGTPVADEPHEPQAAEPWQEPDEPDWETEAPAQDKPHEPQAAEPWQEPDEPDWEPAEHRAEETPVWSEPTDEESWADREETPPSTPHEQATSAPEDGLEDLDEQTRAELEELESQLADLEREIEKRDQKKQSLDDDEDTRE